MIENNLAEINHDVEAQMELQIISDILDGKAVPDFAKATPLIKEIANLFRASHRTGSQMTSVFEWLSHWHDLRWFQPEPERTQTYELLCDLQGAIARAQDEDGDEGWDEDGDGKVGSNSEKKDPPRESVPCGRG